LRLARQRRVWLRACRSRSGHRMIDSPEMLWLLPLTCMRQCVTLSPRIVAVLTGRPVRRCASGRSGAVRRRIPIVVAGLLAIIVATVAAPGTASAAPSTDRTAADLAAADPAADRAVAAADALAASDLPSLRKSEHDVLVRSGAHHTPQGLHYITYDRTHRGLPVIGGDVVIVADDAGTVRNVAVAQARVIDVDTTPSVGTAAALATARGRLATVQLSTAPRLAVLAW